MSVWAPAPAGPLAGARTMADVIRQLGGVPPDRIRWRPTPGTATAADLLVAKGCELIDGTLVEKPVGYRESRLHVFLIEWLGPFIRCRNLGILTDSEGGVELGVNLVRKPDVGFVSWDRFPGRRVPDDAYPAVAPDLAVEVLGPSNTPGEMRRKRDEYFAAGTVAVWEVDPDARTVTVYTAPTEPRVLSAGDVLGGGPVLPGLTLAVADLFAELDRHG